MPWVIGFAVVGVIVSGFVLLTGWQLPWSAVVSTLLVIPLIGVLLRHLGVLGILVGAPIVGAGLFVLIDYQLIPH
jgi:hypothetical protein